MNKIESMFGRVQEDGNVAILFACDGSVVTRIDANTSIYPVGESLSTRYEHPNGIILSREDTKKLGIEIEEE